VVNAFPAPIARSLISAPGSEPLEWTEQAYRVALDGSGLASGAKKTMYAMLDSANGQYVTIDRASLCAKVAIRREATITEHWRKARAAGLLASKPRFNSSSIHKLTIPGRSDDVIDPLWLPKLLRPHNWTLDELGWWEMLDVQAFSAPPWGDGLAPF
jgi:hypothetical protein